jgi:hypothetical protein
MNSTTYGWHIEKSKYRKGTFLIGINFNTNDDYGDERESYLCVYLGKYSLTIGKFHK